MAKNLSIVANGISGDEGHLLGYNVSDNGIYTPAIGDVVRGTTATYIAQDGTIKTAQPNVARVDYTNGVAELLLEPSTSSRLNDNTFRGIVDNAFPTPWVSNAGVYSVEESKYKQGHSLRFSSSASRNLIGQTISASSLTTYVFSAHIKVYSQVSQLRAIARFLNQTYGVYKIDGIEVSESSSLGVGEYLLEYIYKGNDVDNFFRIGVGTTSNASGDVSFDLPQIETSVVGGGDGFRTSWIINEGSVLAQVTRSSDSLTNFGSSQIIDSQSGILFFEGSSIETSGNKRITLNDNTPENRVILTFGASVSSSFTFVKSNSVYASISDNTFDFTKNAKIILKYKENNFEFWINGILIGSDTSGVAIQSNVLNRLNFSSPSTIDNPFYGRVRQVKHLPYNTDIESLMSYDTYEEMAENLNYNI